MDNNHENASSTRKITDHLIPVSRVLDSWRDTVLKRDMQEASEKIPSGFTEIDRIANIFETPGLAMVAARPGMGKTSFALDLALNIGLNSSKNAVIFSYETGKEGILKRLLTKLSSVSYYDLRAGRLSYAEWKRVIDAASALQKANIYIDDSPDHSAEEITEICRQTDSPGIVCVDYFQLLCRQDSRCTETAYALKGLAEQISAPVVCLTQLPRNVESREDRRPVLSDLHPGIQDASDVIIGLYRDHYYHYESPDLAEAIVLKNRFGTTGTAELLWDPDRAAFCSK